MSSDLREVVWRQGIDVDLDGSLRWGGTWKARACEETGKQDFVPTWVAGFDLWQVDPLWTYIA